MTDHKIAVTYVHPPIPYRGNDWCAMYEDTEGHYCGWGGTEEGAIKDLKQRYEDDK